MGGLITVVGNVKSLGYIEFSSIKLPEIKWVRNLVGKLNSYLYKIDLKTF
jgi:hypothetical protein